ncbi:NUDIX domain-containing protein [Streptomyces sp. NRRL S-350]|uniref:NUDIX domain-containing protein n=1 Tax=Streptomyces sp. NRRL S-350 TaxID=1463902 RepID=UPI0004C06891|nr:NUDIX domain-containing protein [Streptomyces sp. NRRL S-350]
MSKPWIPREEFVQTLPRALHGCGVLLFDPDGSLLLLHDSYSAGRAAKGGPQRWWTPGGLLEEGEAPEQARGGKFWRRRASSWTARSVRSE